jgi:chloride channel 3/4/5
MEGPTERTHLLPKSLGARLGDDLETRSHFSGVSKEEGALAATAVGERLPYSNYTTIDWLHDLVSFVHSHPSSWP